MVTVILLFTVTVAEAIAGVHPVASETVTVYVVFIVGETEIVGVVPPVDHLYVRGAVPILVEASRVAFKPEQIVVPERIAVGRFFTVIKTLSVAVAPLASVTVM